MQLPFWERPQCYTWEALIRAGIPMIPKCHHVKEQSSMQHSVALGSQKSRKNIVTFIFQKSHQEAGHLCHNVQGVWYAISIGMYHGGAAAWVESWYSNVLFSKRYRMNAGWIFVHIGCHTCLILQVAGWGFGIKCQSFGLKPKIEICCQQLR